MEFRQLADYFKRIEATASRNAITEILAELLAKASSGEIDKIIYLLQGRVVPLYEAIEFGVADKFIIRAIAQACDTDEPRVTKEFKRQGDVGKAAEFLMEQRKGNHPRHTITVASVFETLYELATTGGVGSQEKKIHLLAELLIKSDPLSARYLVRIPLDKLRLGFSDMTILDGLSWMVTGDKSLRVKLEAAYNVRPDLGYIGKTVKEKGIVGLSHVRVAIGAPILAALAQRLPSADDMIKKMGRVSVEPKYDGSRVQIHYRKKGFRGYEGPVKTFSRNLENTTAMFPELADIAHELTADEVILDGEAIGVDPKTGRFMSFQDTMTRKRKHNIDEARASVPLQFVLFDILSKDGTDLLEEPLSSRRQVLEKTVKPRDLLVVSPHIVTDDVETLRMYHDDQLKAGLEGVVVKKWDGRYEPGRRGYTWVKFKEEEGRTGKLTDTIDAVIMGYWSGQGKRSGFGIGMFLVGVRNSDGFVTLSKIGTGVSDELWKDLHAKLHAIQSDEMPKQYDAVNKLFVPDVWVTPNIVVEIAGDDLTRSPSHGAGVAVRFPRLVRIRTDKSPAQATTVKEVLQMYANQSVRKA